MPVFGTFEMPYSPYASENKMYGRGKNGRTFLKPQSKQWRLQLTRIVREWVKTNGIAVKKGNPVTVNLTACFPPRGGRGKGRKPDVFDYNKLANDGIAKGLKVDDHLFVG